MVGGGQRSGGDKNSPIISRSSGRMKERWLTGELVCSSWSARNGAAAEAAVVVRVLRSD